MLGNAFGEGDDEQRLWNMIIFKIPLTDEEIDQVMPLIGILILVGMVIFAIYKLFTI